MSGRWVSHNAQASRVPGIGKAASPREGDAVSDDAVSKRAVVESRWLKQTLAIATQREQQTEVQELSAAQRWVAKWV
jgi:hypothetical protein